MEIRDNRLYRSDYATFEEYCRERWGWSRRHADRQIAAAEVAKSLRPIGLTPKSESQARELVDLTPEQQISVAEQVDFSTATAKEIIGRRADSGGFGNPFSPPGFRRG